jgi:hypothetical protein
VLGLYRPHGGGATSSPSSGRDGGVVGGCPLRRARYIIDPNAALPMPSQMNPTPVTTARVAYPVWGPGDDNDSEDQRDDDPPEPPDPRRQTEELTLRLRAAGGRLPDRLQRPPPRSGRGACKPDTPRLRPHGPSSRPLSTRQSLSARSGLLVDDLSPCPVEELEAFFCDEILHNEGPYGVVMSYERVGRHLGILGLSRSPSYLLATSPGRVTSALLSPAPAGFISGLFDDVRHSQRLRCPPARFGSAPAGPNT